MKYLNHFQYFCNGTENQDNMQAEKNGFGEIEGCKD